MRSPRAGWRRPSWFGLLLVGSVAAQPLLSFAARNREQLTQDGRFLAYTVAIVAAALLALVAALRWLQARERDEVAVMVAAAAFCFLNYSLLFDTNPRDGARTLVVLAVWLVLTVAIVRFAALVGRNPNVRFAVGIFAVSMLGLSALSFVASEPERGEPVAVTDPGPLAPPARGTPNVYWLLLDAYARPDVLERVVGFDDAEFIADLEARGFDVSSSSLASYPRTHLSLSSTLQMDYVLEPGHDVSDEFHHFAPVVLGRSNTTERFRALGYDIVYGSAGGLEWSGCRSDLVDVCLEPHRPSPSTGELEQTLLDLTPLGAIRLPVPYADPDGMVDQLFDPNTRPDEPFFVLQHIMTPHYPYRYRDDCTPRAVPTDRHALSGPEQLEEYAIQIRCINELVTGAIDRIVERDRDAVILVQSDHGSDFTFTWKASPEEWTDDQLLERYGAFDAMRLPLGCDANIEGLPLINTFRVVFACLEGTDPSLLPYRAFAQPLDDVSQLSELDKDRLEG